MKQVKTKECTPSVRTWSIFPEPAIVRVKMETPLLDRLIRHWEYVLRCHSFLLEPSMAELLKANLAYLKDYAKVKNQHIPENHTT